MKTSILLSIFFLFTSFVFNEFKTIQNNVFRIKYSEQHEQPVTVEYKVKCSSIVEKRYSRDKLKFYKVAGIHTSDDKDYSLNEWDRGHMAPAADFNCDSISLIQTFSYVNCALQHRDLNRGAWKELESYERELADRNIVNILIEVDFNGSIRGNHGALIPAGFKKTIILNGKLFQSYYFKNQKPTKRWQQYLIKQY